MNIYISGISGTGMGPLALMARAAGFEVSGSDLTKGAVYDELIQAGIDVFVGEQDGEFLRSKLSGGVDWFVYTSALSDDHAELVLARESGVECTKRDDFTSFLVEKLGLKMIAVAGTHGKTTTTAMIVWLSLKIGLPISYLVGTTLGFAPSGAYHAGDKYFIYEADEYDRNFLKYHPWLAAIPAVSYDHPDIYPTKEDYEEAFLQFESQSENVLLCREEGIFWSDGEKAEFQAGDFKLAGEARRIDAALAANSVKFMLKEGSAEGDIQKIISVMNEFPGVGRRFERITDGVYSDYAHHPEEIAATVEIAREEAEILGRKGVVVVYQPHQNTRQHEVKDGYEDAFIGASKVFWLPTYLTREDESLRVIEPQEFIQGLSNAEAAEATDLTEKLEGELRKYLDDDYLVIMMTAGPADAWLREKFAK